MEISEECSTERGNSMGSCEADYSDDSSSDGEADESSLAEISRIKQNLSENPYHYQSHIDLITLLKKLGELIELRNARTTMAKLFPLTQTLWMEWIEDEKKLAESEEDHENLVKLFELAVKDYLCPDVWLEYSQYATRWLNLPDGLKKIRDVLERAVAAVGQHVTEGSCIWDMCREFENVMLLNMQPTPGSVITPEQQVKIKKQRERILGLFRAQLNIPLIGMDKTYEEYVSWCEDDLDPNIKHCYSQALKKLKSITRYEETLAAAEEPKLQEYMSYIEHETKSGSSSTQCLYERALTKQSSPPAVIVEINLRSVRNCPWIGQLWILYLEALEKNNTPKEKLDEAFNEAVNAGFSTAYEYSQLWLTRCTQIRRLVSAGNCAPGDLTKCFENATEYLNGKIATSFKETGDPKYAVWTFWSNCEATLSGNVEKAIKILKTLAQSKADARRQWNIWKECYDIIRLYYIGEDKLQKCRGILRQAVENCAILADPVVGGVTDAEVACEALTAFERNHGTIIDMDESMKKIQLKLSRIAKHREKEATAYAQANVSKRNQKKHQESKKQTPTKRKVSDEKNVQSSTDAPPVKQQKRTEKRADNEGFKAPAGLPIRYVSKSAKQATQTNETPVQTTVSAPFQSESPTIDPPPGYKAKVTPSQSSAPGDENNNRDIEMAEHKDLAKDETLDVDRSTVFISNLDYKLEDVGEKLKDVFCACGNIVDVRLVKNNKGQFKGYCYIQFSEERAVTKALQLDRMNMEGRPMFVSPNVDKKKNPNFKVFKYDLGMEKHKLFVSNLSFHTTEAALHKKFSEHGSLKMGLAYIEYEKESDAAQAVMKMDGAVIDDFAVKVAISNPPPRKKKLQPPKTEQFKGSRGRGRTQLSTLVPRSVGRSDRTSGSAPAKKATGGMTNKDFADLLKK